MGDLWRNVVLCDMIVKDIQNKHTLVGVYSGDVLVPRFPLTARLAVYAEFIPPATGKQDVSIRVAIDEHDVVAAGFLFDVRIALEPVGVQLPTMGLQFSRPSVLRVHASVGTGALIRVLEKRIVSGTDKAASKIPASASSPPVG